MDGMKSILKHSIGMYAAEDDGYGDEVDGEDERNDGTNALVRDYC